MPVITATLLPGRSNEKKEALIREVTNVTADILEVQPSSVRVLIYEIPNEHFGIGGKSKAALLQESEQAK